jgi:hypothetical protein
MLEARGWAHRAACIGLLCCGCGEVIVGSGPEGLEPDDASLKDTCLDEGIRREVDQPSPGDVRITEWMANPDGRDSMFEWVEVWFGKDADLRGLELGPSLEALRIVVDGEDCFPVDAGSWVVFGASPAAAPRVDAELRFSLGNSGVRSIVVAVGGKLLDRVDYDGAVEGVATQLAVEPTHEIHMLLATPALPASRTPRAPTRSRSTSASTKQGSRAR